MRRGELGDMTMFFIFLFMMVLVAGSLVGGNYLFFKEGYDYRKADSFLLNYKIKNCLKWNEFNEIKKDFFETCGLDKEVLSEGLILKICEDVKEGECIEKKDNDPFDWEGDVLFQMGGNFVSCGFTSGEKNRNFFRCAEDTLDKEGRIYYILTGSKRDSRRFISG